MRTMITAAATAVGLIGLTYAVVVDARDPTPVARPAPSLPGNVAPAGSPEDERAGTLAAAERRAERGWRLLEELTAELAELDRQVSRLRVAPNL